MNEHDISTKASKHSPMRTCIATGEELPKIEMIRFVVSPDNQLVVDVEEKLPGKGIWIRANHELIALAQEKKLFSKAARCNVTITDALVQHVEGRLVKRIQSWLSLSVKSGNIVTGFIKVESWIKAGKAHLLVDASDGSRDGREKLFRQAPNVQHSMLLTRSELGEALGRDDVVHVALGFGGITEHLQRDLCRLAGFRSSNSL